MKKPIKYSQNFLHNPQFVTSLLSKTNIGPNDTVYDIGSGKGIITDALAKKCHTVISVEFDAQLANKLRLNLKDHGNVLIYQADFLSLPLPHTPYKVFANIPFNLSADIVHKLTDNPHPPTTSYLIVQKEFAEKLVPKANDYHSQLAITLGVQFKMRIVQPLQLSDFYPRPRVETALLEIRLRHESLITVENLSLFKDFIAYTYNAHQPTVAKALASLFTTSEFADIAEVLHYPVNVTPTGIDLKQWVELFNLALDKRPSLEKLVDGYQQLLIERHSKRIKLHRTTKR